MWSQQGVYLDHRGHPSRSAACRTVGRVFNVLRIKVQPGIRDVGAGVTLSLREVGPGTSLCRVFASTSLLSSKRGRFRDEDKSISSSGDGLGSGGRACLSAVAPLVAIGLLSCGVAEVGGTGIHECTARDL
ncbi:hypothetical protein MRX96_006284 [Rhipicephalus microplus]